MTDAQARSLMAAGRLLQCRRRPGGRVQIERQTGETYPDAVARTIAALAPEEREALRGQVAWVRDYERGE